MAPHAEDSEEKINVRDRLTDNVLDLSLMNVSKIPVDEIKALRRATILDLSNNRITRIESNFTDLTQLTQLDLSKNRITKLCDDFGLLTNLRRLDLYNNQLTRLPVTFGHLRNLKYLDLQNNPLNPVFKKFIGTYSDTSDCLTAAKRAVEVMKQVEQQIVAARIKDREQRQIEERLAAEQRQQAEKENPSAEGNAADDPTQDKLKRKRKLAGNEAPTNAMQREGSSYGAGRMASGKPKGISSLLLVVLVILLAVAVVLFSTHSNTLRAIWNDSFGESRETILEEYIK